jgi:hypothetical protein
MPPQHPTAAANDDDGDDGGHRRRHQRPTNLLSDLLSHNAYFDSVVNMIPARLYVAGIAAAPPPSGADPPDNARYRRGQHAESKEARRAREKRARFDPATAETTLETKRRLREESEGGGGSDDDYDDDGDGDDDDGNDDDAMSDGDGETVDCGGDDAAAAVSVAGGGGGIGGGTSQHASRIEALRAKLRARVAALAGTAVAAGGSSPAPTSSSPAAVSKRAARRAEKRRRQEAARQRGVRAGGASTSSAVAVGAAEGGGSKRRRAASIDGDAEPAVVAAATVAGDLATIDYQSLAGLRPKPDGALDNKSLLGMGGKTGNKNRKSLERLLADAERKQARLRELKSSGEEGDAEKARSIEWSETLKVAG